MALEAFAIPWGGPAAQVIVHDGHAPGHGAVFLPDTGVLVAGDMCSDLEIPLLDTMAADPLGDYRTGLERLSSVIGVRQVVPGHGHVGDAGEMRRRFAADCVYLDAVAEGEAFPDPRLSGRPPVDAGYPRQPGAVLPALTRQPLSRVSTGSGPEPGTSGGQDQHRGLPGGHADVVVGGQHVLGGRVDLAGSRGCGRTAGGLRQ